MDYLPLLLFSQGELFTEFVCLNLFLTDIVSVHVCARACVWRSEDQSVRSVLSFDGGIKVRLQGKQLSLAELSHWP